MGLILSFYCVDYGYWTHIARLVGKCPYLLNPLTGPCLCSRMYCQFLVLLRVQRLFLVLAHFCSAQVLVVNSAMAVNCFGNDFRYGTAALTCLLNFWAILPKSCRKSLSWHVLSLTHNIPQPIQPCCLWHHGHKRPDFISFPNAAIWILGSILIVWPWSFPNYPKQD